MKYSLQRILVLIFISMSTNSYAIENELTNKSEGFVKIYDSVREEIRSVRYERNKGKLTLFESKIGGFLKGDEIPIEGSMLEQKCHQKICKEQIFENNSFIFTALSVFPNGKILAIPQDESDSRNKTLILDYSDPTNVFQTPSQSCPIIGDKFFLVESQKNITASEIARVQRGETPSEPWAEGFSCLSNGKTVIRYLSNVAASAGAIVYYYDSFKNNDGSIWRNFEDYVLTESNHFEYRAGSKFEAISSKAGN